MLNYWWVTRPKRKLDPVPEVLTMFADLSLDEEWSGQMGKQLSLEDALESAGLKRKGERRDQRGSGARTYETWIFSLGLIFFRKANNQLKLTLAGEAIMSGDSPVDVLKGQVIKYQFPSSFSKRQNVQVSERFKIHPFWFLLKLLTDERLGYLTQDEIAMVVAVEAENESRKCYEYIVRRILQFRDEGYSCIEPDFAVKYASARKTNNPEHPYSHLDDLANTLINWVEYTQLARRDENRQLRILEDKLEEVQRIVSQPLPFIDRPEDGEYFQRKYGLDPKHKKDTRDLSRAGTITAKIIAESKIQQAYLRTSLLRPISSITTSVVNEIVSATGIQNSVVEDTLRRLYPHGSIGAFMASYFEMAFKGTKEAIEFEKATTEIFRDVFKYNAIHLGQTGSKSAPDILLLSDDGYQAIIDNKAYAKYSISGDHHNRMVHNYVERLAAYSSYMCPLGFFSYIAGGFGKTIDKQIQDEVDECGVNGSGITVSTFIKMIENQTTGTKVYSHADLRTIFGLNRQIMLSDVM